MRWNYIRVIKNSPLHYSFLINSFISTFKEENTKYYMAEKTLVCIQKRKLRVEWRNKNIFPNNNINSSSAIQIYSAVISMAMSATISISRIPSRSFECKPMSSQPTTAGGLRPLRPETRRFQLSIDRNPFPIVPKDQQRQK